MELILWSLGIASLFVGGIFGFVTLIHLLTRYREWLDRKF